MNQFRIVGICTYANTPILIVLGIFWLHGPNFDQISQIPSVTSYLGKKKMHLTVKMVQFGNFEFLALQHPHNPKLASMDARTPKRALIILFQFNNDHGWQKINFGKDQLFCAFFIWSDPKNIYIPAMIVDVWCYIHLRWSRFTFSCLVVQCAVQTSPPTMCEFLCCLQQSNGPPTHRSPHTRLTFAESYSARSFTFPDVSNNFEIDYVVLL